MFDAAKRKADLVWSLDDSYTAASLPNLGKPNVNGTWYIDGGNAPVSPATAAAMTLAQFNTIWPANTLDPNTARYNCDTWVALGLENYPALQYARSIGADIPNIQQLMRIFCCMGAIDVRDPTVADYPALRLASLFVVEDVWSSSEGQDSFSICGVDCIGACSNLFKTSKGGVLPVLEL